MAATTMSEVRATLNETPGATDQGYATDVAGAANRLSGTRLDGRVALVTGAAGALGQAVSARLAARGAEVFGVDLNGSCDLRADLATVEGNRRAVESAVNQLGRLDVLVLNAGLQYMAPIADLPPDQWGRLIDVMLSGPFFLMQAAWPHLTSRFGGRIIVTASTSSFVAERYKAPYVAAKHGVLGLVKVAALEGVQHGLTVNAVAPAWMWTPMAQKQVADRARLLDLPEADVAAEMASAQPAQRFVEADEVAATIAFLASPEASGITGSCVPVDLGALA